MKLQCFYQVGIQCVTWPMDSNKILNVTFQVILNKENIFILKLRIRLKLHWIINNGIIIIIALIDNNNSEGSDADLYVRYDRYECISNIISSNEQYKLNDSIYYVMVDGFDTFKNVKLKWSINMNEDNIKSTRLNLIIKKSIFYF